MHTTRFVQNIIRACQRKGVKPTVACRESGAGERMLENVKRGSIPSVDKVWKLAQYLDVTVSELLGEVAEASPDEPAETVTLHESVRGRVTDMERMTVGEVEMVRAYRLATPKERALIDTMLAEYKKGSAYAVHHGEAL